MTNIKNYFPLFFSILSFTIASCSSSEIADSKDVNQETIYQDYKIEYTEGETENIVDVWAQFRFGGDKGTTLVLNKPSNILFNDNEIKLDSNEYSGAFYRLNVTAKDFFKRHHFDFTDISNKKFENNFSFDTLKLLDVPVTASKTLPLVIKFEATVLQGDDYIEITAVNTDSSFTVKHSAADPGNSITIPVVDLNRQKGQELSLSVSIYKKISLQQQTKEGGQIITVYTLKPLTIGLTKDTGDISLN